MAKEKNMKDETALTKAGSTALALDAVWDTLPVEERLQLTDTMVPAHVLAGVEGAAIVGNILSREEFENGPSRHAEKNPKGIWHAFRVELIRPLADEDQELVNETTGEALDHLGPGDIVLVPETARLVALGNYVGACIGLRPAKKRSLSGGRTMWLYDGVLISRNRVDPKNAEAEMAKLRQARG